jgi:hypothetical protein
VAPKKAFALMVVSAVGVKYVTVVSDVCPEKQDESMVVTDAPTRTLTTLPDAS